MEGMLMLPVIVLITVVLTCALGARQGKLMVSLLFCAAMMSACIPAGYAEEAEAIVARPVIADAKVLVSSAEANPVNRFILANEQMLENGTKTAQIGSVTYNTAGEEGYLIENTSSRVRVKHGDTISFEGTIYAPEGETISWIRVDVYDANPNAVPYTVGAEYYRVDGLKAAQFDLASIPVMKIGKPFGWKDYSLVEGGRYIFMICAGDSNGNGFADTDTGIEEDQGPAIAVDVKMSPENCRHPHSNFAYILHSSGEYRRQSYGDGMTHQVEPLYERYCGLCDTFLMNIWGQGAAEEHDLDLNGVCLGCGYYTDAAKSALLEEIVTGSMEALKALFESFIKSTNPNRQVNVVPSWENENLTIGDTLTLTAEMSGYEGLNYTVFWQCDKGNGFEDVDMADGHTSIQFVVDEENKLWRWRAGVDIEVDIPEAQEGTPIVQETEAAE